MERQAVGEELGPLVEKLGAVDLVSQELVIGITGGLQKQEWMFAAEQPSQHS